MSILFETIARHARDIPEKRALRGTAISVSYGALPYEIEKRQSQLAHENIRVLGIQTENSPDWILWDLAALASGIACVPLPPFFNEAQITHVLHSAGVDACLTHNGLVKTDRENEAPLPPGTAKITFTSGTTGTPKGVCLPRAAMETLAQTLLQVIGPEYGERHLSVMPLGVLLENIAGVYTALMAGTEVFIASPAEIGMNNPFQPELIKLAGYIAAHDITSIILVPELLRGLLQVARINRFLFSSLRFTAVGGATVSPELLSAARMLGLPVYEGYGLSECGSVVSLNTPASDHPGTAGKILPHVRAEIAEGEIVIQNPAFLGYLGEPPRNPEQPFATGDLGHIDENGALHITGRKKNVIITAQGRNISPEWVESHLLAQPEIAQAFVYGNDRPFPAALIVPAAEDADIVSALARANMTLPSYARITAFDIVPPFTPQNAMLTGTGRLRREQISKTYQHLIEKENEHDTALLRQAD